MAKRSPSRPRRPLFKDFMVWLKDGGRAGEFFSSAFYLKPHDKPCFISAYRAFGREMYVVNGRHISFKGFSPLIDLLPNLSLLFGEWKREPRRQAVGLVKRRMGVKVRGKRVSLIMGHEALSAQAETVGIIGSLTECYGAVVRALTSYELGGGILEGCAVCGWQKNVTLHHITPNVVLEQLDIPRAEGKAVLVPLCRECHNQGEGGMEWIIHNIEKEKKGPFSTLDSFALLLNVHKLHRGLVELGIQLVAEMKARKEIKVKEAKERHIYKYLDRDAFYSYYLRSSAHYASLYGW